jgi:histone H3/H4
MYNLLKRNTDKRVSKSASTELGTVLEQFAGDLAEEAIALAHEADYRTVQKEHVKQALRN